MKNLINLIEHGIYYNVLYYALYFKIFNIYFNNKQKLSIVEQNEYNKFINNYKINKQNIYFTTKINIIINNTCYILYSGTITSITDLYLKYKCIITNGKEAENIINILLEYIKKQDQQYKNNTPNKYLNMLNIFNNKYSYKFSDNYSILNIYFHLDNSNTFDKIINLENLAYTFINFIENTDTDTKISYYKKLINMFDKYLENAENTEYNKYAILNINFITKISDNIYYCFSKFRLHSYCGNNYKKILLQLKKFKNNLEPIIYELLDKFKLDSIINNYKNIDYFLKNSNYIIDYNSLETIQTKSKTQDLCIINSDTNKTTEKFNYNNECYILF